MKPKTQKTLIKNHFPGRVNSALFSAVHRAIGFYQRLLTAMALLNSANRNNSTIKRKVFNLTGSADRFELDVKSFLDFFISDRNVISDSSNIHTVEILRDIFLINKYLISDRRASKPELFTNTVSIANSMMQIGFLNHKSNYTDYDLSPHIIPSPIFFQEKSINDVIRRLIIQTAAKIPFPPNLQKDGSKFGIKPYKYPLRDVPTKELSGMNSSDREVINEVDKIPASLLYHIAPFLTHNANKVVESNEIIEYVDKSIDRMMPNLTISNLPKRSMRNRADHYIGDTRTEIVNDLTSNLYKSRGTSLGIIQRLQMERIFPKLDFSFVKIHYDAESDQASRAIGAQAFTLGRDIFFRKDSFDPISAKGLSILGHELVHVQQTEYGTRFPSVSSKEVLERSALSTENALLQTITRKGYDIEKAITFVDREIGYNFSPIDMELSPPIFGSSSQNNKFVGDIGNQSMKLGTTYVGNVNYPLKAEEGRIVLPETIRTEGTVSSQPNSTDIGELSRQIYRQIERQIIIEKERYGVDRWDH